MEAQQGKRHAAVRKMWDVTCVGESLVGSAAGRDTNVREETQREKPVYSMNRVATQYIWLARSG